MATFEKRVGAGGKTTWRVRVRRQIGPQLTKSFACGRVQDAQQNIRDAFREARSPTRTRDAGACDSGGVKAMVGNCLV